VSHPSVLQQDATDGIDLAGGASSLVTLLGATGTGKSYTMHCKSRIAGLAIRMLAEILTGIGMGIIEYSQVGKQTYP
jgi:ABC-type sulfate/molybdate transport systems ATPase subunit